jgi:hypothetical protein
VPLEKVKFGIKELLKADAESRSKEQGGRRLVPLDSHREWGWVIVNYRHYRSIVDEEGRRKYFRDAKQKQRASKSGGGALPGERAAIKVLENEGEKAFDEEMERQDRGNELAVGVSGETPSCEAVTNEEQANMVLAGNDHVICERCGLAGHAGEDCPVPMHLEKGQWTKD